MRSRFSTLRAPHALGMILATSLASADGHGQTSPGTVNGALAQSPAATEKPADEFGASALERWVVERGGKLTAHAVEAGSSSSLFSINSEVPLNPASTMKLVTAAVALDLLGPDYRYQTGLYGTLQDGRCEKLVLRGHGDPSLAEADLWRLVNSLVNQGLTAVTELLVDQSAFDDIWVPPGFEQQPKEWAAFRAPISAVALEQNTLTVNVMPGAAGTAARVWVEPAAVAQIAGRIESSDRGKGERITLEMAPGAPLTARVGGSVPEGVGRLRFSKRLDDPRLAPGLNLAALLEQRGIKVGRVGLGGAEVQGRLTYSSSAPLSELLRELGKASDNFYAETIFKSLARVSNSAPASSVEAATRVRTWLEQTGPLPAGTRITNGSGLFDSNLLAASTLTRVLSIAATRSRLAPEFITQLAIGGTDGTLRSRFERARDQRNVRAKTGTLNDTIALAGYVLRDGKAPIAFAIIVADIKGRQGELRGKIDEVVERLGAR